MMGNIEQRLQVLERQFLRARRVNRVLIFILIAIFCITAVQSTTPSASGQKMPESIPKPDQSLQNDRVPPGRDLRTVEADQFVLVDRLGRSRAMLLMNDDGPALSMFDEKGEKKLEISHTTAGSALHLLGANKSPIASLRVPRDDADAQLEIKSSQGSSSMKSSGISVKDREENQRLLLALINGNFPILGISQSGRPNGPPAVEITASDDGSRQLKMHDDGGHPLFSVSAAKDTSTFLNMSHPDHERSLQISAGGKDTDGPVISFFAPAKQDAAGGLLPWLQFGLRIDRQPYIRIVDSDGRALFTAPTK